MELNERGRQALARFRAHRGKQPFLDRRTVVLAVIIAVVLASTLWVAQRQLGMSGVAGLLQREDLSGFSVYLHHQGCPGPCPVYAVLVRGDGTVEYEGVDLVAMTGSQRTTVDALTLRALSIAVRRAEFDAAPDAIKPGTANCATWSFGRELMQIGVTRGGRTHTVDFYPGCEPGDPRLEQLAHEIDALAGTARWVSPGDRR